MPSAIDPSKPIVGNPTTASVRDNFAAAKAEIEALQAQVANIIASFTAQAVITADFPKITDLGAPPALVWQTRPLNTIIDDGGFLVSLVDNVFTLPPGLYAMRAEFPVIAADRYSLRLHNISTDLPMYISVNDFQPSSDTGSTVAILESLITLPVQSQLAYQQQHQTQEPNVGWGLGASFFNIERHGRVTIRKLPQ